MSLGLHEDRRRRKRKARWYLAKWLVTFALIGAAGAYAYESGSRLAEHQVTRLEEEVRSLTDEVADLRREAIEQQRVIEAARVEAEELRRRYDRDVPTGELRELFDLMQARLDEGLPLDRLRFVMAQASVQRDCDGRPTTKRFVVRTPLYQGRDHTVSFADGTITVTGVGAPARDAAGNPEAWFDVTEPVTLRIAHIGGTGGETTGLLPLNHAIVIGDTEHRFSAVPGPRGFVEITADRCRYP
ncbi:MAG: hypothetical protein EA406_02650 [Rhodospirillales bacterium]|nr:MAG: hypothetical protein EA406_02650 [Rhodospirillales bacterium]